MSLASSSKGNSYFIGTDKEKVLLDLGISFKKIKDELMLRGIDIKDIDACFISHEHSDHIRSIKSIISKIGNIDIYMSQGTLMGIKGSSKETYDALMINRNRLHIIKAQEEINIKDLTIIPFNVSHDTNEPLMYSFLSNDRKLSVVTDTGIVTDEIFNAIKDADTLVIESNHEPDILMYGKYPYPIKKRILSDFGHLSNELCGECLTNVLKEKRNIKVFLAHLSENNNTPEQARLTITNYLEENDFIVGKDLELETLQKEEQSKLIEI